MTWESRPWGGFEVLSDGVTALHIAPGAETPVFGGGSDRLHWVVTSGTGNAIVDGKDVWLFPGVHVEVPPGANYALVGDRESRFHPETGEDLCVIEVVVRGAHG